MQLTLGRTLVWPHVGLNTSFSKAHSDYEYTAEEDIRATKNE